MRRKDKDVSFMVMKDFEGNEELVFGTFRRGIES